MKRTIITITDSGIVHLPSETRMTISEIADLFEIYYRTAKRLIRKIEKTGIAQGDDSMDCHTEGKRVYPDYYGLEMVIAVVFRVQSEKAGIFRNWILRKLSKTEIPEILIMTNQNPCLN